jgi:hypothetical protein
VTRKQNCSEKQTFRLSAKAVARREVRYGIKTLAVGRVRILVDRFSVYRCPRANTAAANTMVSSAIAKWWTWFISRHCFQPKNFVTLG